MSHQFHILTLFPEYFASPLKVSLLGKAIDSGLLGVKIHDIRDWATDRHRTVDDIPYGGGPGMVLKPEPVAAALEAVGQPGGKTRRIYFSPRGKPLRQQDLKGYLSFDRLILLCGRYEGVDQRAIDLCIDEEISVGDYLLSGGEAAALVFIEALSRLVPGVLGKEESLQEESFEGGVLEYPQYTRPPSFRGHEVPPVLLSGDHGKIAAWRREEAKQATLRRRPDLIKK